MEQNRACGSEFRGETATDQPTGLQEEVSTTDATIHSDRHGGRITIDFRRSLPYRLSILGSVLTSDFVRFCTRPSGLSIAEWRVLAVIAKHGAMPAKQVCDISSMDKGNVSRAVANLVRLGYLQRGTDPAGSRRAALHLTALGERVHAGIAPLAVRRQRELVADLSPEECEQLVNLLTRLEATAKGMSIRWHRMSDD